MEIPRNIQYKAIFTDLDGTAVPSIPNGMPSQVVIDAIAKAQEKVFVSVATGRPFKVCRDILEALQIKNLCIVEGGSQIINPVTEEVVWEQAMSEETVAKIMECCQPYTFLEVQKIDITPDDLFFAGTNRMIFFYSADQKEVDRIYESVKLIPEVNIMKVRSWRRGNFALHISHIGASKRHALEVLLGMLNLEAHEVIGIGDSQNDLPLFEAAGFKIAMGNAIPELKAKADYIAPSVMQDGLAHVIEEFIL
jgi:HAD superfamily hydrolase (TIGR01484 family)